MIRFLRLEFALAALMLAPLIGYAIVYLLTRDAVLRTGVSPAVPVQDMQRSESSAFQSPPAERRLVVRAAPIRERRT